MQSGRGVEGELLIAEYKQKLLEAARHDIACMKAKEVGNLFSGMRAYEHMSGTFRDATDVLGQMGVVGAGEFLKEIHASNMNKPASLSQKPYERFREALDEALVKHEISTAIITDAQKQSIEQYLVIQRSIERFTDSLLERRLGITVRESTYETAGMHLLSDLTAINMGFEESDLVQRMAAFARQINSLPISNQTNRIATEIANDWIEQHRRDVRNIVDMLCVDLPIETRRDPIFHEYAREVVRDQLLHHDRPHPGVAARILGREPQDVTRELANARQTVGELLRFTASAPRMHLEHAMREFISKGEQGLPYLQSRARG